MKAERAVRKLHNSRLLTYGRKSSINYGLDVNVPGWDVIIVGELGDNASARMQRNLKDSLEKRGWSVRLGNPLWQAGEEGGKLDLTGRTNEMQSQRAQFIASTCKASIVFLSPEFYEKTEHPSAEMYLIRAVLQHQGETEGNKIIPVLLPPFSILLNQSFVGRRSSLIEEDHINPFIGQYGMRLKQCFRNGVVASEDHSNFENKVHNKLMNLIKEGPYGSVEDRREFFSPSRGDRHAESQVLDGLENGIDHGPPSTTAVKSDAGTFAGQEEAGEEEAKAEENDTVTDFLSSVSLASYASNAGLVETPHTVMLGFLEI